jgi:hypothetical protein
MRLNLPETDKQRLNRLRQESNAVFEAQPEGVSLVERDYALAPGRLFLMIFGLNNLQIW